MIPINNLEDLHDFIRNLKWQKVQAPENLYLTIVLPPADYHSLLTELNKNQLTKYVEVSYSNDFGAAVTYFCDGYKVLIRQYLDQKKFIEHVTHKLDQ